MCEFSPTATKSSESAFKVIELEGVFIFKLSNFEF